MKHLLPLLAAAVIAPLSAQDWAADVERACTHPRYGLRLAASRKVAEAGAVAVPAIRAFQQERGAEAIPVALVEAIASGDSREETVVALLLDWAGDRDFYWRAQALRGLAERADPAHRDLFLSAVEDPAWLTRVQGARGLDHLGRTEDRERVLSLLRDPDPRVRTRIAAHLLDRGRPTPQAVRILLEVLLDEREFLGDPWGQRMGREALTALESWLGTDGGYDQAATPEANREAVQRLAAAARDRNPDALPEGYSLPRSSRGAGGDFAGGIEVLSCRNGDLFLRWTADGVVTPGLEGGGEIALPSAVWARLRESRDRLPTEPIGGVVICDKIRMKWDGFHAVAAPASLPRAFTEWLKALASALEESGGDEAASMLRDRLQQFAAPGDKE